VDPSLTNTDSTAGNNYSLNSWSISATTLDNEVLNTRQRVDVTFDRNMNPASITL